MYIYIYIYIYIERENTMLIIQLPFMLIIHS